MSPAREKLMQIIEKVGCNQASLAIGVSNSHIARLRDYEAPISTDIEARLLAIDISALTKKERRQPTDLRPRKGYRIPSEGETTRITELATHAGWAELSRRLKTCEYMLRNSVLANKSMPEVWLNKLLLLEIEELPARKRPFGCTHPEGAIKRTPTPNRYDRTRPLSESLLLECSPLLHAFINQAKSSLAIKRYQDLYAFVAWRQAKNFDAAISCLLNDKVTAHQVAQDFAAAQLAQGRAPKTITGRACALRQLVKLAHSRGLCGFLLETKAGSQETVRDTRGPGMTVIRQILDAAKADIRTYAILRLFVDLALRVCEVSDLMLEHLSMDRSELMILGKGRASRERIPLPAATKEALSEWLTRRGNVAGPLWAKKLTTRAIYRIVRQAGQRAGIKLWPHALRHSAITNALELTSGDVRKVMKFSRHKSLDMLMVYDDARQDAGGEVASLVAKNNSGKRGKRLTHKELLREIKERLKAMPASELVGECLSLIG